MENVLRIRSIKQAAAHFKELDSKTCLTETAIRTLVRSGRVASTRVGRKYLVTIEALEQYLQGKSSDAKELDLPRQKTIWRI